VVDSSAEEVCGVSLLAAVAAARCMNCTILGQSNREAICVGY
jgi:hypothetical protein